MHRTTSNRDLLRPGCWCYCWRSRPRECKYLFDRYLQSDTRRSLSEKPGFGIPWVAWRSPERGCKEPRFLCAKGVLRLLRFQGDQAVTSGFVLLCPRVAGGVGLGKLGGRGVVEMVAVVGEVHTNTPSIVFAHARRHSKDDLGVSHVLEDQHGSRPIHKGTDNAPVC